MPRLTIDNQPVRVEEGSTILAAARTLGIDIPTLCFMDGLPPGVSCMVCVVNIRGRDGLVPACSTWAEEGMVVETGGEAVREARRTALELLLSDHPADCVGPCQSADPRAVNIPVMIRQVAAGDIAAAVRTLAAGEGVPAPEDVDAPRAERACRRGRHDEPVAIGLLMRYVAAHSGRFRPVGPGPRPAVGFTCRLGLPEPEEMQAFLADASAAPRVRPAGGEASGYTDQEARAEAARCLHCDCRKPVACKLRRYAEEYGVRPGRFRGERRAFRRETTHPAVVYESGKCIACGICARLCESRREPLGLTFVRRGFDVRVAAPFDEPLSAALTAAAEECVLACPTGALAFRDDNRNEYGP